MHLDQEIQAIEQAIRRLKIEYDKYFVGANDVPPTHEQEELRKQCRDARAKARSTMDRFRTGNLEARFNSMCEMYQRRLRAVEEGRERRGSAGILEEEVLDPMDGIKIGRRVSEDAAAALYTPLFESNQARRIDLQQFKSYLEQQSAKLREKTGCQEVSFRLSREGGQLRLKAKPVRSSR